MREMHEMHYKHKMCSLCSMMYSMFVSAICTSLAGISAQADGGHFHHSVVYKWNNCMMVTSACMQDIFLPSTNNEGG